MIGKIASQKGPITEHAFDDYKSLISENECNVSILTNALTQHF